MNLVNVLAADPRLKIALQLSATGLLGSGVLRHALGGNQARQAQGILQRAQLKAKNPAAYESALQGGVYGKAAIPEPAPAAPAATAPGRSTTKAVLSGAGTALGVAGAPIVGVAGLANRVTRPARQGVANWWTGRNEAVRGQLAESSGKPWLQNLHSYGAGTGALLGAGLGYLTSDKDEGLQGAVSGAMVGAGAGAALRHQTNKAIGQEATRRGGWGNVMESYKQNKSMPDVIPFHQPVDKAAHFRLPTLRVT